MVRLYRTDTCLDAMYNYSPWATLKPSINPAAMLGKNLVASALTPDNRLHEKRMKLLTWPASSGREQPLSISLRRVMFYIIHA